MKSLFRLRYLFIFFLMTLLVSSLFIAMSGCNQTLENKERVISIGVILPLSGDYAVYGQNEKKGIDLALSKIDTTNFKIKVLYEDNKGTPKDAVTAIKKLAGEDVVAIIDDAISSITLSIVPIAEQYQIPIISTGATNPKLSGISQYFFRIWNSDSEEGSFAAKAAIHELKAKTASIIYLNSDYGDGLMNVFKEKFINEGGKIINIFSFNEKTNDYKNIISKINNNKCDLIYLVGYAPQTGLITKTLREYKNKTIILSTVATEDAKFIELAGIAAEGVYYVNNLPIQNDQLNQFRDSYLKMYNESPQMLTDVGYDALVLIISAIKDSTLIKGKDIVKYLNNMKVYHGASGEIIFDKNGDVHKPMMLKIIKDGTFSKVE